ncbi:HNH endonuclease signature motif containing protein [Stenotrophomonas maltophilia]|uniref:HNH endonuclease signature motif containing protein n=1 Tax=Stenotrophomonas maltophilia TaxID=40324 RepID=UPI003D188B31
MYRQHRLAWLYMTGQWPSGEIDHINHDRSDNRWHNLRDVSHQANQQNRAGASKGRKYDLPRNVEYVPSGRRKCFRAVVTVGRRRYRGSYVRSVEQAQREAEQLRKRHMIWSTD